MPKSNGTKPPSQPSSGQKDWYGIPSFMRDIKKRQQMLKEVAGNGKKKKG